MRVLVVGGGAREHALVWSIRREPDVDVFCALSSPRIALDATTLDVQDSSLELLVDAAVKARIDLAVIGPEAPLVAGLADRLRTGGIAVFGPGADGARLEGSKVFAKEFMARHGIPTAEFAVFSSPDDAEMHVRAHGGALVVKADGLAAGKGVVVAADTAEAVRAVDEIMRRRRFGAAGNRVVVEECLVGEEVSYHVVLDGERYVPLAPAQDHKRVFEGDKGPNTGGMGAYCPPIVMGPAMEERVLREIVEPSLAGMRKDGISFRGVLFVGLMITDRGPRVLEYNVRFGDPECQTMLVRWQGSILALLRGAAAGDLRGFTPMWESFASLGVVMASGGYPGPFVQGRAIDGLDEAAGVPGVQVFHAGTAREGARWVTAGGRVLTVCAAGPTLAQASSRAYEACGQIQFEGLHFRRDIGWRTLRRGS